MTKTNATGRTTGAMQPFVQVLKPTLKEPAWKALSYGARCLYITLKSYYFGDNNGRVYLGVRKAARELGASRSSTEIWFRDLTEHGFIVSTSGGFLGSDGKGTATSWRLTEIGYMGEQPTKDYKDWPSVKNRIPSQKMVHPVPKKGTGVPKNGTVFAQNRHISVPKNGTYILTNYHERNGPKHPRGI